MNQGENYLHDVGRTEKLDLSSETVLKIGPYVSLAFESGVQIMDSESIKSVVGEQCEALCVDTSAVQSDRELSRGTA